MKAFKELMVLATGGENPVLRFPLVADKDSYCGDKATLAHINGGKIDVWAFGKSRINNVTDAAELIAFSVNTLPEVADALSNLFTHCVMIHRQWGENSNEKDADAAINACKAVLAKLEGDRSETGKD
jgi:hypothetical protein